MLFSSAPLAISVSRKVKAPPEAVWTAVADAGDFARFADGIAHTEVTGPLGVGMLRVCTDDAGGSWSESCTLWEEGRRYRMEVDVDSYPWYYRTLIGALSQTWTVAPWADATLLTLEFSGRMRLGFLGRVAGRMLGRRGPLESILAAYESEIVGTDGP